MIRKKAVEESQTTALTPEQCKKIAADSRKAAARGSERLKKHLEAMNVKIG
ncbi:hypothetical protein J2125_000593 [Erwinia toletana]|uniref:Uncharacterized protein n=1 Tax=Winslowiella toletana TaxID=92490 RepID=A0ABS4P425_9GAMM|nr:hypothetical protein [Winslowiella toletana]MBP2167401.1 hypothetical protein [Winslowiella toletana]